MNFHDKLIITVIMTPRNLILYMLVGIDLNYNILCEPALLCATYLEGQNETLKKS